MSWSAQGDLAPAEHQSLQFFSCRQR
ncbi:hypothetical protein PCAR4_830095 [Paraburkholderia caribensis]|nr:hypothetical protein PCAR4_830095 [Paraburkholderia caribensis]